jgi:SHS2 domain-containing protein
VIEVEGSDRETLLVNWLNEILLLEQTRHEVYDHFLLSGVTENHLRAQLYGWQLNAVSHPLRLLRFTILRSSKCREDLKPR